MTADSSLTEQNDENPHVSKIHIDIEINKQTNKGYYQGCRLFLKWSTSFLYFVDYEPGQVELQALERRCANLLTPQVGSFEHLHIFKRSPRRHTAHKNMPLHSRHCSSKCDYS